MEVAEWFLGEVDKFMEGDRIGTDSQDFSVRAQIPPVVPDQHMPTKTF